ncbi:hemogen isoform X2 [Lemur catta]|uniref:hemogen isoform X2 n=1 Tax=Lemur catta TaxID=9447 RepID=UPI001E268054|nr:hemogen isoform X2 [Lemur catta]
MDLGKDKSHLKHHQTSDPHQEENHTPEVIGSWSLRNREQLRKRKAESQENQTSQWLFGEQKKHKWQRTGKGNQRGRKRKQNTEMKVEPQSQTEKEIMEQALAPTEKETELPGSVSEALPLVAFPQNVVPKEHFSGIHQESIINQENSSEYQEVVVQNHSSETCEQIAEPENCTPKTCQEIAVLEDHPLKMCQGTAEPEGHAPKMSQEITVLQDRPLKMCQETAVPKALPCTTSDHIVDLQGCSPEAYSKPHVPTTLDTYQKPDEPEQYSAESDQEIAENEGFSPKTQEIAVPKDLSTKTFPETVESEHSSHKTYTEITVPKAPSHKTIQETPQPEEYSPETYQETPAPGKDSPKIYQETPGLQEYSPEINQETLGPEDLSTKIYENKGVPNECFPEPYQEIGGPIGQDKVHQKDAKDVYTFPQEVKEKPKAEEPEIPAILNSPQEISPENDVYSYVLF